MNEFIKKKWHIVTYFIFMLITAIIVMVAMQVDESAKFKNMDEVPWTTMWHYDVGDGVTGKTYLPAQLPRTKSDNVIFTNTLPDIPTRTSLMFRIRHVDTRITVGDEVKFDTIKDMNEMNSWYFLPGMYYCEIELSPEDSGKTIVIESTSKVRKYLFNPGGIYLGDRGTFMITLLRIRMGSVICIVVMLFIAVLLFFVWLFMTVVFRVTFKQLLCLSLFIGMMALWLLTESRCIQYVSNNTRFSAVMAMEILMLAPIPIALFFSYGGVREKTKEFSNYAAMLPLAVFVVNNILHFGHLVHLADTMWITQLMLAVELVTIAYIQVNEIKYMIKNNDENTSMFWKIPLVGIVVLVPAAAYEIINYAFKSTKYLHDGIIITIAILFYVLALVVDSGFRMAYQTLELNQRAKQFKKETETKTQFLANMSHEIRTPINAIIGFDELILRESKDKKAIEYAQNIRTASDSLMYIINSILDITKIESGKLELYSIEYDTIKFFDGIANMIENMANKKGLDFEIDIDEKLPETLIGDENHIRQVVINILNNAVKYTEAGSVRLTVKLGEKVPDSPLYNIYFSIKDTGIGIKKEDMGKLFEKFERLDKEKNYNTEGTGLGMSIVVSLLEAMGSKIEVDSEYGKGSDFHFVLQQCAVSDNVIGDFKERRKVLDITQRSENNFIAPRAIILIVDDVQMNLDVAEELLNRHRITIDKALSGKQALEMIQKKHYDLVLMDHMMPELDGIETTQIIRDMADKRNDIYYATLPIIALTANAIVGMKETFLQAGMHDFVSKPVNAEDLSEAVRKWLPADKVEIVSGEELQEDNNEAVQDWEDIPGFEMDVAREYNISQDMFKRNLKSFFKEFNANRSKLLEFREKEDGANYQITIHGLKSVSKLIGAMQLSEEALELEMLCKDGKLDEVWARTDDVLELYEQYKEIIQEHLNLSEESNNVENAMPEETYMKLLADIKEAADKFNMGQFMQYEEQLESVTAPEEHREEFKKVKELVANAAFGDASEYLKGLLK